MARTQADRKAETRSRLIDAAADQFARSGFHAVSADVVADAADRTSGSLYAHFGGKEGLLLALLDDMKDATAAAIRADLEQASTVDERIAALWRHFADPPAGREPWVLLEHELWLYAARNPAEADRLAERYAAQRELLAQEVAGWTDGDATSPQGRARAVLVLALLLGLEMQRRIDPDAVPDDLAVASISGLLDTDPRNELATGALTHGTG